MNFRLSVLDLSPVSSDSNGAQALRNTIELARLAARLGYRRYWLAGHQHLPTGAGPAPAVIIGPAGGGTSPYRGQSGAMTTPHHACKAEP